MKCGADQGRGKSVRVGGTACGWGGGGDASGALQRRNCGVLHCRCAAFVLQRRLLQQNEAPSARDLRDLRVGRGGPV